MLSGGVDVLMAENVRNQIDVPGFPVQICSIGTPELMGSYLLKGRYGLGIFLYKLFHRTDGQSFILQR